MTRPRPLRDRFLAKVRRDPSGCLIWTACTNSAGYGRIAVGGGRYELAHRVAWQLAGRVLTLGLELDHKQCENPLCCEVEHLEEVPHRINVARGRSPSAVAHRVGQCSRGHAMTPAHGRRDRLGKWRCNTCRRVRRRAKRSPP